MNEQDQATLETRSRELSQVRSALDALRRKHSTMAEALSHVLHESREFEARALAAEKLVATLQTENATLRSYALAMSTGKSAEQPIAAPAAGKTPGELAKVGDMVRVAGSGGTTRIVDVRHIGLSFATVQEMADAGSRPGVFQRPRFVDVLLSNILEILPSAEGGAR